MTPPSTTAANDKGARVWLSRGLPELFDRHHAGRDGGDPSRPPRFDVLIVGSGYGGAVAAAMLAGCRLQANDGTPDRPLRIALLERGDEYLPGSFPSRMSELPGHVRFTLPGATSARGVRWGLFDVRVGADVVTVVANGLGGGSLINAGVMLPPRDEVLAEAAWPGAIRSDVAAFKPFFDHARRWLGADRPSLPASGSTVPPKLAVMKGLGGTEVPITIARAPGSTSSAGVPMQPCLGCGDCATGCNHGAKESLDVNLLVHARRAGVEIYTGATVLRLEELRPGWAVVLNHTDPALRDRQTEPLRIEADKVVLAAGTLGSTEILMRSREHGLALSCALGKRFSANGDLFAAAYKTTHKTNAIADETVPPAQRNVGPTIMAAVDKRCGDPLTDLSIQELAVPGPLRRLFEEVFTTARTLHSLGERDDAPHVSGDADRNAVDAAAFCRTLPLALISRDAAAGKLELVRGAVAAVDDRDEGDGAIEVRWPGLARDERFDRHHETTQRLLCERGVEGRLLPNPAWKLQPDESAQVLGLDRGPLLTVHPLGGCSMADDGGAGVVNELGQVFQGRADQPTAVYDGLVVLDGSIVPTSLGINPALTITALAIRAVEGLRRAWNLTGGIEVGRSLHEAAGADGPARPVFRRVPTNGRDSSTAPAATQVQIIERLRGEAVLADGIRHHLELTLHSHPVALATLMSRQSPRRIDYNDRRSVLRVFREPPSSFVDDPARTGVLEAQARVCGSLEVFSLAPTRSLARTLRALVAWLLHRGFRDLAQDVADRIAGVPAPADPVNRKPTGLGSMIRGVWALASRAGAERTFEYDLQLTGLRREDGGSVTELLGDAAVGSAPLVVHGRKRITYDGRRSPWLQLSELHVDRFPGMSPDTSATLRLDLPYLARQGIPLVRVVSQQDHAQALVDLASFLLYLVRTILDGHMWSFRRPDSVPPRAVRRLPGATRGLRRFEVQEIEMDRIANRPVCLRLTRYRPRYAVSLPPVLLIHGYSASGTTFVHPTLRPGLAGRLVREGRDVWVLDLRSSAGMPWARHPWTFEQVAYEDIPMAVDRVVRACGGKVDVVAHCMGAAMLCMALLGDIEKGRTGGERFPALRRLLRDRIRRIVLSQVGPALVMSPSNQARAFVMRYVKELLPFGNYEFRPEGRLSLADMLLDRLLATLPYPPEEFRRENPLWPPAATTPWVQTRHRMDALYGTVFKLDNMATSTLRHLDDFFGPMNVDTVSQVIHFTWSRAITDAQGRAVFATPERLRGLRRYPILSLHSDENGLVDVATADLLEKALGSPLHEVERLRGFGHQDPLIGRDTRHVFDRIVQFLGNPTP